MVNTKNISIPARGQNDSITMKLNEADFVISVQSPHSQCWQAVSDLFLFKFLSRLRKVLRFCGNINSVLLHITCHPGGLWLISTYFSSLGPALIQMASGTPDQQPEIQPNPVRDFRTHRETHSWLWMMFVCFIYFEIFMIVNVIFDSKYCIWIYININIRQKYDVCSL